MSTTTYRINSLDLLKGLAMVIMALDHVRDYFHAGAFLYDPGDPVESNLPVFITRWVTHFCAPTFSFLAGTSAFLAGRRRTKKQLSSFLFTRGLWLVFIELTVVTFAWFFDIQFRMISMLVIWSLGVSMVLLAGLIHLPRRVLLGFCLLMIVGHNLMDGITAGGNVLWSILHIPNMIPLSQEHTLLNFYPIIPWVGVMGLGYGFGPLFDRSVAPSDRKRLFIRIGIGSVLVFLALRLTNLYGDPQPFSSYPAYPGTIISLFNPSKYPPSLQYLLMTLGGSWVFLAFAERWKGKVVDFFSTFGRVPFFYYILHLYLIHLLAMAAAEWSGWGWQKMILTTFISFDESLRGYGFSLWITYAAWIAVILILYPACRWFDRYKQAHKEKWWLSYL